MISYVDNLLVLLQMVWAYIDGKGKFYRVTTIPA